MNLIHGLGSKAKEAVVQPPDVKVISFTGSTLIGCHIAKVAVPLMKKLSLELGGKNAALVFADAKLVRYSALKCVILFLRKLPQKMYSLLRSFSDILIRIS